MLASSGQYVCLRCRYGRPVNKKTTPTAQRYLSLSARLASRISLQYGQLSFRRNFKLRKLQPWRIATEIPTQRNAYSAKAASRIISLQPDQLYEATLFVDVERRLHEVWRERFQDSSMRNDIKFEQILEASGIKEVSDSSEIQRVASKMGMIYAEKPHLQVHRDLKLLVGPSGVKHSTTHNSDAHTVLNRLGIVDKPPESNASEDTSSKASSSSTSTTTQQGPPAGLVAKTEEIVTARTAKTAKNLDSPRLKALQSASNKVAQQLQLAERVIQKLAQQIKNTPRAPTRVAGQLKKPNQNGKLKATSNAKSKAVPSLRFVQSTAPASNAESPVEGKGQISGKAAGTERVAILDEASLKVAGVEDFKLEPMDTGMLNVPRLSFDLSRVLFNPGVYQLQDPRSRVWNFDPYLGKIMPVSEFNYDALNKYITSSEDDDLRRVALQHQHRYIGSTSSLSGTLSHFHFLLSAFRPLKMENMSRGFGEEYRTFTRLHRGPTAIFLRWRDGTYAVDADKEFDSANILMSLGRSMEKLLTLEKTEFEQYRKKDGSSQSSKAQSQEREEYHYTRLGQFLLRSQLDCHDPRIPGTGMFDLKTRAVAGVRMMLSNHETGQGYQIKGRFGTWESYEREYYDMMRAAFLKYSLQVRMGRMDGIFVAYHNVSRIFGFQYISLPEMDLALHGQTDKSLGDREFRLSFKMLNDIFDQATAAHPETSLRFHFEAREATAATPAHMYIFAEPVSEEEIHQIQTSKRSEIEAYEQRIFNPPAAREKSETEESNNGPEVSNPQSTSVRESNAADVAFLENLMGVNYDQETASAPNESATTDISPKSSATSTASEVKPLLAWRLAIRNIVNGKPVVRPVGLSEDDTWDVEYNLTSLTEAMGRRNYGLCKNRRQAALEFPQDEDSAAGYYIQQLVAMSRTGAEWRRRMDELDAQREQVVLYGNGSG